MTVDVMTIRKCCFFLFFMALVFSHLPTKEYSVYMAYLLPWRFIHFILIDRNSPFLFVDSTVAFSLFFPKRHCEDNLGTSVISTIFKETQTLKAWKDVSTNLNNLQESVWGKNNNDLRFIAKGRSCFCLDDRMDMSPLHPFE